MANPYEYPRSKIPVPESPYILQRGYLSDLTDQIFFDDNVQQLGVSPVPQGQQSDRSPSPSPDRRRLRPGGYGPPGTGQIPGISPTAQASLGSLTIRPPGAGPPGQDHKKKPEKKKKKKKKKSASRQIVERKLDELLAKIEDEKLKEELSSPRLKSSKSMEDLMSPTDQVKGGKKIPSKLERKKSSSHPRVDKIDSKMIEAVFPVPPGGPSYPIVLPSDTMRSLTSLTSKRRDFVARLTSRDPNPTKYVKAGGPWRSDRGPAPGSQMKKDGSIGAVADKKEQARARAREAAKNREEARRKSKSPSKTMGKKGQVRFDEGGKPLSPSDVDVSSSAAPTPVDGGKLGDNKSDGSPSPGPGGGPGGVLKKKPSLGAFAQKIKKSQADLKAALKGEGIKDAAAVMRLLTLCQKCDWHGVDQALRYFEKTVLTGDSKVPLALVADEATGTTPLMYAVKDNRVPLAERMLALGSGLNTTNKIGETPLHVASHHAKDETVRFLLFKKAETTIQTVEKKESIVHYACKRASGNGTNILKSILTIAPKDIRLLKDSEGNIPIITAMENGNRSAITQLLHHLAFDQMKFFGGPNKETPLHLAIRKKDIEVARLFVDAGANVDAKNAEGQTPLHLAAATGDENLVKFFYMCKANPNIADKEDRTPIHIAAQHGHTAIIELLTEKFKVSLQRRTKDGSTLLHIASLHGHPETAMYLYKNGVPLQMPNKGGARSLHIAAKHGHGNLICKLLEKGEKVDSTTNDNYTALHIAVENGRANVVETLLGYGAEVHIKGGKGQETPLHIAARVTDGDKCAQMLLKSGADANITMDNGETPLHLSARYGRLKIIRLLLNDGGDPMQKSKIGETALHLACRFGHIQVVKVLLQFVHKEKGEKIMTDYINSVAGSGESALHYSSKLSRFFHGKIITDDGREIATLLLNGGGDTTLQTKETHETAFHFCSKEGNNEILREMLSRLNNVEIQRAINKQSTKGWSPLLLASHKGHFEVVKTLLENSARVDVFDNDGRSALHLAAEHGYQEVSKILLDHKAYINAKSRIGFTALHYAAKKGYKKLCIFLIQEYGAYADVVTLKKQTPLHLAAESGQLEVCRLLMGLRASPDATDEKGQKPIHLAAQNNHPDVIKLFLKHQSTLVTSSTKDGSTCAHLAAMQGSIEVLEELMKFDKNGVISARNRTTDATALQLAAEGGHAELVKTLLDAGASATDENKLGYAAVHSASKNGHTNVIEALRSADAIQLISRKLGLNALHIASHFGQAETVRELLVHISATTLSEPPVSLQASFLKELGMESGLTPLHFGSYAGEENVVRLLLNYPGVLVDAPSANFGYNPLHLGCLGGHLTVAGLLLSRSSELLESRDKSGKTGLHLAADRGHMQLCEILLGQGAEIDAQDKEQWTPLHCAAKAGHLGVIRLLVESNASPLAKNAKGKTPIYFAAAENHLQSLMYLMKKEHDTYDLLEDNDFVFNMTICGKNYGNEPMDLFILSSPAPVDVAAKLSAILEVISTKEKEREKDLLKASAYCEAMTAELLALASGAESAGKVLQAVDRKNVQFLDVLIENEKKEVIAHTVVQRYLQELWVGSLAHWASWKLLLLFLVFIICPPIWIIFSLPMGHKFYKIPIIKFMSYLTSHIVLMILICITAVTPITPVLPIRSNLFPQWNEWILLTWIVGLCWSEITNPSDKGGLGWVKVAVLSFALMAISVHVGAYIYHNRMSNGTLLYSRNQLFAVAALLCCVQILDFLSFHQLFGPWAIIIGNLMKDLARFLAVLMIFMVGFSFVVSSLNYPTEKRNPDDLDRDSIKNLLTNGISGVLVTPIDSFELLFFALFGLQGPESFKIEPAQPVWTIVLFKIFFGIYLLVTVIVLINLLIAMMSDTYQRIQAQSDIEWKFGLAKLIRNMHRTTATASPINIFTAWIIWIVNKCHFKREPFNPLKLEMKGTTRGGMFNFKTGKGGGPGGGSQWKNIFKKSQIAPKVSDIMRLSIAQGASPMPMTPVHGTLSQVSIGSAQRIENVVDWPLIARKYRALVGKEEPTIEEATKDDKDKKEGQGSTTTLSSSRMGQSQYNVS